MNQGRITLFPYGAVSSSQGAREKCLELLLLCGADLELIHDQAWPSLAHFINHIERLSRLNANIINSAIVCLTQTCPIFSILNARRELTGKFPGLAQALWAVFVDQAEDPSFSLTAGKIGNLTGDMDEAPIWTVNQTGQRYLLLTPHARDSDRIQRNAQILMRNGSSVSSMRAVLDPGPEFTDSDLPTRSRR